MCFGNPKKSLEIARERMTPEAWAEFEREFVDFTIVNGLDLIQAHFDGKYELAKWAFLCGRPREPMLTEWMSCSTPPVRDGWYEVERNTASGLPALENARIQATCDDPNAPTILGGSTYICLNGPTWNAIVKQLKERGA